MAHSLQRMSAVKTWFPRVLKSPEIPLFIFKALKFDVDNDKVMKVLLFVNSGLKLLFAWIEVNSVSNNDADDMIQQYSDLIFSSVSQLSQFSGFSASCFVTKIVHAGCMLWYYKTSWYSSICGAEILFCHLSGNVVLNLTALCLVEQLRFFGDVCVITAAICSLLFTVQHWCSLLFLMFTNGIIVTVCIVIVCHQALLLVIFGVFLYFAALWTVSYTSCWV